MARTAKERGRTPTVIEFDTDILERLRIDARSDQRSVGYLVRQIVNLHYVEIDDPGDKHPDRKHFDPVFGRMNTSWRQRHEEEKKDSVE